MRKCRKLSTWQRLDLECWGGLALDLQHYVGAAACAGSARAQVVDNASAAGCFGTLDTSGGSHALRWKAAPRGGSFADRARGTGDRPPIRCTAVKDVRRAAEKRYEQLEEESGKDTNMHLPARRAFVERKQQANKAILDHPIMEVWKRQVDSIHLPDEGDKPSIVGSAAEVTMTPHQARAMLE